MNSVAGTRTAVGPEASGAVSGHSVGMRYRMNTEMNRTLSGRRGPRLNDKVSKRKWTFPVCLYFPTVSLLMFQLNLLTCFSSTGGQHCPSAPTICVTVSSGYRWVSERNVCRSLGGKAKKGKKSGRGRCEAPGVNDLIPTDKESLSAVYWII